MKALCWHGKHKVSIDRVPDPTIQEPTDAIIKITSTAICGSDLHLFDGYQPTMEEGDILGHEPMGVVVETGASVTKLKKGDRVVVPFVIACGTCFFCSKTLFSSCDSTNPNAVAAAKLIGGTVSVPGVYVGMIDKFPFGGTMGKGVTIKTGQTHVQRYGKLLLAKIEAGEIDPSFVITHRLSLEEAPAAYTTFRDKEDGCIKVVLKP